MNICFLARPSFDRYSVAIVNNLRKRYDSSIGGYFITTNEKESQYVRDNVENPHIYETATFLKQHWAEATLEKLISYEKKYDCSPIWKYIYTDRFLINRDYDYCIRVTVGLFSFFEEIFSKNKIDFYYSEAIATLQCYIAYLVGKKYGVQYVTQMPARGNLDNQYHYFIKNEYHLDSRMDGDWRKAEYSLDEMNYAESYLSEFEAKDCPPPTQQLVKSKPKIDRDFLLAPLRYVKSRCDKNNNDPYSYMYYKCYRDALNPIVFWYRYNRFKKLCKKPACDEKYVYFPLHYQPEASTIVCAQKYEKQLFFIDSLAKSIPADTVLYVKDHYAFLGHRELSFYSELKKYPNVKLIDPFNSSRKLMENSVAVVTLTGTAGYEAMLLRKPVIIAGRTTYENAPGVARVDEIFDNYVDILNSWEKPTREDIKKYICAMMRSYSKGNTYAQNYYHLIKDNINDICDSLYTELVKMKYGD